MNVIAEIIVRLENRDAQRHRRRPPRAAPPPKPVMYTMYIMYEKNIINVMM